MKNGKVRQDRLGKMRHGKQQTGIERLNTILMA
jgi:hypothetical protein